MLPWLLLNSRAGYNSWAEISRLRLERQEMKGPGPGWTQPRCKSPEGEGMLVGRKPGINPLRLHKEEGQERARVRG